jgi:hypothetical protein
MSDIIILALEFGLIGTLFTALGIPLKRGKVPPNMWYGFRTRKTLSNEDIWYAVNRATGEDMIRGGVSLMACSFFVIVLRDWLEYESALIILLGVTILTALWMFIHGISILRQM